MNDIAGQLRDIHGLDAISAWPPAPGWWLVAAVAMLGVWLLFLAVVRLRRYPPGSWNRGAYRELIYLRSQANAFTSNELARRLSELLRRIAISRYGREGVAALQGQDWIDWLSRHDPRGFRWQDHAELLLRLPYAPPADGTAGEAEIQRRLLLLIDAAMRWTRRQAGAAHAAL